MDWEDVENKLKNEPKCSHLITINSEGLIEAKDKQKFDFLVPCFLWCYSMLRPEGGKDYVIYRGDKRVRKPYPILPLVTALLLKRFNKYCKKFKKISAKDIFLLQGLAFHNKSCYYKKRESEHQDFFISETAPEVFLLHLEDGDEKHFDDISLHNYTQYITKSFFRKCLVKIFDGVEISYDNYPFEDFGGGMPEEHKELYNFFYEGGKNFLSSLNLGKEYLNMIEDDADVLRYQNKKPGDIIQGAINLHMYGEFKSTYKGNPSGFRPDNFIPFFPSVNEFWNFLYERDGDRIDKRLYGEDKEKYRYEVV